MPSIKVYVHFIWSTKNREPLISKDLKPLLLQHIKENSIKKGIFIDFINCKPILKFQFIHDLKVVATPAIQTINLQINNKIISNDIR